MQHAPERAILFIQYFYLSDTRPEARKRRKKCADFCEVGPKEAAIEQFFDLGLAAAVKTKDFILPYAKLDIVKVPKTRI